MPDTLRGEANPVFYGPARAQTGNDVAYLGDMDGDGFGDLAIPDREYERAEPEDEHQRGVVYLVYGREDFCEQEAFDDEVLLEGDDTFTDQSLEVEAAGDLDGDGHPDLLVGDKNGIVCIFEDLEGETGDEAAYGRVYVVYGGTRLSGAQELHAAGSMIRHSTRCSAAGQTVAGLGDIDEDGYGDFAFTADTRWDDGDDVGIGRVYVVYGGPQRLSAESTEDVAGAVLRSEGSSRFGFSLAAAGDVDADGHSDFLVTEKGRVWIVRGAGARLEGELAISDVGVPIGGMSELAWPSQLGDLDADGAGDFALSVHGPPELQEEGDWDAVETSVHLFYGGAGRFTEALTLDEADASITRPGTSWSVLTVAAAGDFDGDAHGDLIFGDPSLGEGAGGIYLGLGNGSRLQGEHSVADLGVRWLGTNRILVTDEDGEGWESGHRRDEFEDRAGENLSRGGDIDGDGLSDVFVGASTDHVGGELGGRVYVIRGR